MRITEDVFVLSVKVFVEDYFICFFSPMRNASAKGFEKKAPTNNNLPNP